MKQERTEATEWEISVASASSADSIQVGSRKDRPGDSFRQLQGMETDDQSRRHVEQFHIAEETQLMNGMNRLDGFCFNKQAVVNQQIETPGATRPFGKRGDKGNREIISVISVDSCSVDLQHLLNMPSAAPLIDRQMRKSFLSHPLAKLRVE